MCEPNSYSKFCQLNIKQKGVDLIEALAESIDKQPVLEIRKFSRLSCGQPLGKIRLSVLRRGCPKEKSVKNRDKKKDIL